MNHDTRKKNSVLLLGCFPSGEIPQQLKIQQIGCYRVNSCVCHVTVILLGVERYKWVLGPAMSTEFQ